MRGLRARRSEGRCVLLLQTGAGINAKAQAWILPALGTTPGPLPHRGLCFPPSHPEESPHFFFCSSIYSVPMRAFVYGRKQEMN